MSLPATTVVPYFDLKAEYTSLRDEVLAALDRVCRNASFILGAEVEAFERQFATICGTNHCVALNSGTSALHLGLLALGVQHGDEVITTPNTFIATAEAITYCGARPVFVDVDPETANIDPKLIERAITPATKAIVPVHLYGRVADMDAILEIASHHHLKVLEDACQAHGAHYRGRPAGSLGHAAAFSFYPSKNLGAYGEAGALTTNDDRIAQFARAARTHGQTGRYEHEFVGYNYRMEGFQGAVLQVKMKHFAETSARRRELAQIYRRLLAGARVHLPYDDPRDECAYHLFVVYVDRRDEVRSQLAERGIETAIHYPRPLHLQPAYADCGVPQGTLPRAESACNRVISLPFYPGLNAEQVEYVANTLREIVGAT
ncbi:MAG: DegT/DnrJ/EryC1/StrS family aminotransferase [Candidatus Acidiferrales bacterium]